MYTRIRKLDQQCMKYRSTINSVKLCVKWIHCRIQTRDRTRSSTKMKRCCRSYNPLVTERSSDTQAWSMWSNAYLDLPTLEMSEIIWNLFIFIMFSFPSSMVSSSFPAFLCPGTAGRKRNVILVCVEGLKSAASIRKSEISERPKADVWKKCRKKWSYYVQHCIVHMLNKMPLKSLENPEIKFERSKRKHRNPRAAKNPRYLCLKRTIWLCMTVWNPMSPSVQVKIHRPRSACTKFLRQHPNPFSKSKVRNPKSIPKGWMFVCGFGIGLLILEGPGKSPLGNLGTMRWWSRARFEIQDGMGGMWLWLAVVVGVFYILLYCLVPGCMSGFGNPWSQRTSIVRFSPRLCHRINSKAFQKRAQPNIPVAQNQMSCHILSSWHSAASVLEVSKTSPCSERRSSLASTTVPRQKLQLQRSWRGRQRP